MKIAVPVGLVPISSNIFRRPFNFTCHDAAELEYLLSLCYLQKVDDQYKDGQSHPCLH